MFYLAISCDKNQDSLEIDGDWRVTHVVSDNEDITGNILSDSTKWKIPLYKTKLFYIDLPSKQWVLYIDGEEKEPTRGKFELLRDSIRFYNSSDARFNGLYHKKMEYDTVEEAFKNAFYFMTLESKEMTIMAVKAKNLPISTKK